MASIHHLLNKSHDFVGVLVERDHVVGLLGGILVEDEVGVVVGGDLVEASHLSESAEEVISSDGSLTVEEGEPEDLGILGLQSGHNLLAQVIIHNIFEIDFVEVVGPWVEHAEALVLDALGPVLEDVVLDELEGGLVSGDWVLQVVLVQLLLWVADEGATGADAGRTLEVLGLDLVVKKVGDLLKFGASDVPQNTHKHLLEALEVPVLVDAGVDHSGGEHLLGLEGEQVHQVVHLSDGGGVGSILRNVVWE